MRESAKVILPVVLGLLGSVALIWGVGVYEGWSSRASAAPSAAPVEEVSEWTPEVQSASDARERCLNVLKGKFRAPIQASLKLDDLPRRAEGGWAWKSSVEQLSNDGLVPYPFTCQIDGDEVAVQLVSR